MGGNFLSRKLRKAIRPFFADPVTYTKLILVICYYNIMQQNYYNWIKVAIIGFQFWNITFLRHLLIYLESFQLHLFWTEVLKNPDWLIIRYIAMYKCNDLQQ